MQYLSYTRRSGETKVEEKDVGDDIPTNVPTWSSGDEIRAGAGQYLRFVRGSSYPSLSWYRFLDP